METILFEHKETIPDWLYLELMNALKKENDERRTLFELTYRVMMPCVNVDEDGRFCVTVKPIDEQQRVIVDMSEIGDGEIRETMREFRAPIIGMKIPGVPAFASEERLSTIEKDDDSFRNVRTTKVFELHSTTFVTDVRRV